MAASEEEREVMDILKTAASLWLPATRKKSIARDERYRTARSFGINIAVLNTRVDILRVTYPKLSEIDCMDVAIEQLRVKG